MSMQDLQDARENFVQGVQNTVAEDLSKNGLELESVSLTSFNQTAREHFNPDNAFDAEGLTLLTRKQNVVAANVTKLSRMLKWPSGKKTGMHSPDVWRLNSRKPS